MKRRLLLRCIKRDGSIVAAAQEERFNRKKQFLGFPVEAIRYCLSEEDITGWTAVFIGDQLFRAGGIAWGAELR